MCNPAVSAATFGRRPGRCAGAQYGSGMPPTADPGGTRRSAHRASGAVCETAHPNSGKGPRPPGPGARRCPRMVGDGFGWQSGGTFYWNCSMPASLHPFRRPSAEDGGTFRWQLFDASGSRWDEPGNRARRLVRELGRDETPAALPTGRTNGENPRSSVGDSPLDERGTRARSGRMRTLAGTPRWTNGGTGLVGSYEELGRDGTPAAPRGTNGEPGRRFRAAAWQGSGDGSLAAIACRAGRGLLVTFYRELRGTGVKG